MDRRTLLEVAGRYASLLDENNATVRRSCPEKRLQLPADRFVLLNHARWQVEMARSVICRVGGELTAIRLLGSAQGLLLAAGLSTVEEVSGITPAGWIVPLYAHLMRQ